MNVKEQCSINRRISRPICGTGNPVLDTQNFLRASNINFSKRYQSAPYISMKSFGMSDA